MEPAIHVQPAPTSASNIFSRGHSDLMARNCCLRFSARPASEFSIPELPNTFLDWFREHRVSSLDHRRVFRTHAGGSQSHRKTLLRAVPWLSSLDLAASDPDRCNCGNVLRSPGSLGATRRDFTRSGYTAWELGRVLNFRYYFILSMVARFPIGEEPGWRGFALPILQSRYRQSPYGSAKASLLLGLIWSAGICPFSLYEDGQTSPFWIYAIIVTALSIIITLAVHLSGGSVITAILVHNILTSAVRRSIDFLRNATIRQHSI